MLAGIPNCSLRKGDMYRLPFGDSEFNTIIIDDVLVDARDPVSALSEARRLLRPGGRFVLAEPNAHSPLIRLQMALVPAERGAARSDEGKLGDLLGGLPLTDLHFAMAAPFPLDRVVFHPDFGLPRLGRSTATVRALAAVEGFAGRLLGRRRWSYIVAHARRARDCAGSPATGMRP